MNKSVLSLGVAIGTALAIGASAKADAKVVTPEQAAIQIDAAANKVATTKKNKTVRVELKASLTKSQLAKLSPKERKKAQADDLNKQIDTINDQLDDLALDDIVNEAMREYYRDRDTVGLNSVLNKYEPSKYLTNAENTDIKISFNKKKLKHIVKVQLKGKTLSSESLYGEKYCVMNANDFATRLTPEMTEKEKGWEAARYVMEHMEYGSGGYTPEKFYKKKASGICSTLASIVVQYMELAGVKTCGIVKSENANHDWNFIEDEEGKIWYLDAQHVDNVVISWRIGNERTREEIVDTDTWDKTHGLAIYQMERFAWETKDEYIEHFEEDEFKDDWEYVYYVKNGVSQ